MLFQSNYLEIAQQQEAAGRWNISFYVDYHPRNEDEAQYADRPKGETPNPAASVTFFRYAKSE